MVGQIGDCRDAGAVEEDVTVALGTLPLAVHFAEERVADPHTAVDGLVPDLADEVCLRVAHEAEVPGFDAWLASSLALPGKFSAGRLQIDYHSALDQVVGQFSQVVRQFGPARGDGGRPGGNPSNARVADVEDAGLRFGVEGPDLSVVVFHPDLSCG